MNAEQKQMGSGTHQGPQQQQYVHGTQQNPNSRPPQPQIPVSQYAGTHMQGQPPQPRLPVVVQQPHVIDVQPQVGNVQAIVRRGFTHGPCDCCQDPSYACFAFCCGPCAVGDLRAGVENNRSAWNFTVGILFLCWLLTVILGFVAGKYGNVGLTIFDWVFVYFLYQAAKEVSSYLGFIWEPDCGDCCCLLFCPGLFLCMIGNEVSVAHPRSQELLLNMERNSPCGTKPKGPRYQGREY